MYYTYMNNIIHQKMFPFYREFKLTIVREHEKDDWDDLLPTRNSVTLLLLTLTAFVSIPFYGSPSSKVLAPYPWNT